VPRTNKASSARPERAQRESMQSAIYQRLGQAAPSGGTSSQPSVPLPRLSRAYIQTRIRSDFVPLAEQCYESLLASQPQARGKAVVEFAIAGDPSVGGIVESAELSEDSTLKEPEFETCLRESLLSVTFEPPAEGGRVTITYPFEFSPD
jgi:hypothetical protein